MKIGIALAAYQPSPQFFSKQLESIARQTFSDWVCIITLDSSLDQIRSLPELSPFFKDPRFNWFENEIRLGHKKNFQNAIQKTLQFDVDAIACSDQDDIWYENKLSTCIKTLKAQPPLSLVHSDMHILRDGNIILPETAWAIEHRGIHNSKPRHLLVRNIVAGCSMLFDAELARRYPIIPEEAEFHDHWYALVAAYHGGIQPISKPLYAYRQHQANEVGVSPYHRIFYVPEGTPVAEIFKKCKRGFEKSYRLIYASAREKLPVSFLEKFIFFMFFDFGLGLLILGLFNIFGDRPLARACFARGAGKLLTLRIARRHHEGV